MSVEIEVSDSLLSLTRTVSPPFDITEDERTAGNKVFELLKDKSRNEVDRVSMRKRGGKITAVIFVNISRLSEISGVLEDFQSIFSTAPRSTLKVIQKSQTTLQVEYNDHNIELVPTINFLSKNSSSPPLDLPSEQAFQTLEKISNDLDRAGAGEYSSAFAETHLRFVQQHSLFIYNLIQVGEYWYTKMVTKGQGQSNSNSIPLLLELVAIYSGQLEETIIKTKSRTIDPSPTSDKHFLSAFITFLRLLQEFPDLKIRFEFDPLKPTRTIIRFPQLRGAGDPKLRTPPYVIDPANPLHNLAADVNTEEMEKIQFAAAQTLWRMMGLCQAPVFRPDVFKDIFA